MLSFFNIAQVQRQFQMSLTKGNHGQLDVVLPRDKERKYKSNCRDEARYVFNICFSLQFFRSCKYFIVLNTKIICFIFGSIVQHCFSSKIETDLPFYFYRNVHHLLFNQKDEARKKKKTYNKAAPPKYSHANYFFM